MNTKLIIRGDTFAQALSALCARAYICMLSKTVIVLESFAHPNYQKHDVAQTHVTKWALCLTAKKEYVQNICYHALKV